MTPAALSCVSTVTGCGSKGVFSVIANSTNAKEIVTITNETTYPISAPFFYMDKGNYEGFNLLAAP